MATRPWTEKINRVMMALIVSMNVAMICDAPTLF
jgi:hypothetical protein